MAELTQPQVEVFTPTTNTDRLLSGDVESCHIEGMERSRRRKLYFVKLTQVHRRAA